MKILGIDPGTNILGWAIIETKQNKILLIDSGTLDLRKIENTFEKLNLIYTFIDKLLSTYKINQAAIESPFYGKNPQSMLKLGRAQGVAIAAVLKHKIPIYEYAPRKIKLAVTGNGNASKYQVAKMVQNILHNTNLKIENPDETDAIAIALCHQFNNTQTANNTYTSWKDFAKKHKLL